MSTARMSQAMPSNAGASEAQSMALSLVAASKTPGHIILPRDDRHHLATPVCHNHGAGVLWRAVHAKRDITAERDRRLSIGKGGGR